MLCFPSNSIPLSLSTKERINLDKSDLSQGGMISGNNCLIEQVRQRETRVQLAILFICLTRWMSTSLDAKKSMTRWNFSSITEVLRKRHSSKPLHKRKKGAVTRPEHLPQALIRSTSGSGLQEMPDTLEHSIEGNLLQSHWWVKTNSRGFKENHVLSIMLSYS